MDWTSSKPSFSAVVLTFIGLLSGTVLYLFTLEWVEGGLVNPIWGSLYGFGFLALSPFVEPRPGIGGFVYFLVGAVIWPLVVTLCVLFWINKALLNKAKQPLAIALLSASFLVIFPMNGAPGTVFYYLPIYGVFLDNF